MDGFSPSIDHSFHASALNQYTRILGQVNIYVNNLPFLKQNKVPKLRKMSGTSKYGFSEEDEIAEHALQELSDAVDAKDHKKLMSALSALIDCINNKEEESEHEIHEESTR